MADLLQILKGTGARPRITFYSDGTPANLDSGVPTVTITKPDGTTIASGTVTKVSSTTGIYEFTLAPQAECTYLTVTWAGLIGGITETLTTYIEVIGAFLFTIADLRALKVAGSAKFASTTDWPDAQLQETRTAVLDEFTEILGFSPVPRYRRAILDGAADTALILPDLMTHRIISVAVNGTTQVAADYQINDASQIEAVSSYTYGAAFTRGRRNIVVEYVHGWQRVIGDGGNVAMVIAAAQLDPSVFASATTVSTPDGSSYSFDPAGQVTQAGRVRHYGIPKVDAWLHRHAQPAIGVA